MATYLPGITDYIPHIQPFKPDYNFYQKALETKEAQYKAGYDKISNLYGTLLNSELTREPDKVKRDQFFLKVQKDIQRMSSVDLSLQENVNTAYRVFQPIIDDQNFTHDVVYTKKFYAQQAKAEQIKNCFDPKKCGDLKWWKEGDLEMQYKRDEYANADDKTALTMSAPNYTPYVDVAKKLDFAAKEANIDVQTVTHTRDGYNVTTTNGQQVVGGLSNYFTSILSSDPNVQALYKTKAYLERKNFAYSNADKYGGREQAESVYLKDKLRLINESNEDPKKQATLAVDLLTSQVKVLENKMNTKGIPASEVKKTAGILDDMYQQLGITTATKEHVDNTTASIDPNDIEGLDNAELQHRVDEAMSRANLTVDSGRYANYWAQLHSKESKEADPYDKMAVEFEYSKQLKAIDRAGAKTDAKEMEEIKHQHRIQEDVMKFNLENGIVEDNGPRWKENKGAMSSTAKVPLVTANQNVVEYIKGATKDSGNNVSMSLYTQLYSAYKDGETPEIKNAARLELNKVFGGHGKDRGYLNDDYTLRSITDPKNKLNSTGITLADANNDEKSFFSWQNLYKRSVASLNSPVSTLSTPAIEALNRQKSDHEYVQSTSDKVWHQYVDDRAKIYKGIKASGASELIPGTKLKYKDAADIANVSFSEDQFVEKFKQAHPPAEYPGIDIDTHSRKAYQELVLEYNARYTKDEGILGLHSLSPSWSPTEGGGGGKTVKPMVAHFDGANQSGKADIASIKADLDNPSTVVVSGTFQASDKKNHLDELVNDPAAKAAANFAIEAYLKGGWTKSKENSENRPIFDVSYTSVVGAGGDDNPESGVEAITFHFDEESAMKNRGTDTKPSSTDWLFRDGVFNPDVTLYVNKETAKNAMHANTNYTMDDYNLQAGGTIVLDGYKNYGGVVRITKSNGLLKAAGTLNWIDDKGTVRTTNLPEQVASTNNVLEFKKTIYDKILGKLNKENIENQITAYNSQKKAFTREQMAIILKDYGD